MAKSIFITSVEGETGKSSVALGTLELLVHRVSKVGVFRPISRSSPQRDYVLELLLAHDGVDFDAETCTGVTYEMVHSDPDAAMAEIVSRYAQLESQCDAVVIVGSDYTDVSSPTELSFNARIAANLGSPVVLVLRGWDAIEDHPRSIAQVTQMAEVALHEMKSQHAQPIAVIVNRCEEAMLKEIEQSISSSTDTPTWAVPEDDMLFAPTVSQIMEAVEGTLVWGDENLLGREVVDVVIAAMSLDHVFDNLKDGDTVITPGDRSDVLLGLVSAHSSDTFPSLSATILNGGFLPAEPIQRLLEGLEQRLPIISTSLGTFETAARAARVKGRLSTDSQRKIDTALGLFDHYVDSEQLLQLLDVTDAATVTPLMFEHRLLERARSDRQTIVLPEGEDDRILRSASTLLARGVVNLIILGQETSIRARASELGLDIAEAQIIDIQKSKDLLERFTEAYAKMRAHKGVTVDQAAEIVKSPSYFATMMVELGLADGMVSGATHTTANTIRPAFEIIKTVPEVSIVSSVFLMCLEDRVLVYGDCAVNPDPTAEQLADIALSSAQTAEQFGIEPRVAMLSYSTGDSGTGADVDKVREATKIVRERRPDLLIDGPIQYDAAVDETVGQQKAPDSPIAGRATVLIFPDLNTGNNTYKAVQRSAGAIAIGPVLQGLRKPVNDLSRGALVQDIVNTVAITAIQAQQQEGV